MTEELEDAVLNLLVDQSSAYTDKMHRYSEFQEVFLGTDAGKRVLKEIMIMGRMTRSTGSRDPYETARRGGERDHALEIAKIIFVEPKEPPKKQITTDPRGSRNV